jgi:RNA polymerase sigma factor (sigma-70 family)
LTAEAIVNDDQLMAAFVQSRDATAAAIFEAMLRQHVRWVQRLALREVGDPQLAEDLASCVFAELIRRRCVWTDRDQLRRWLRQCVARLGGRMGDATCRGREGELRAALMARKLSPEHEHTLARVMDREAKSAIGYAITQLSRRDRSAVLYRFFEGKQLAEVGQEMGISTEAARKRVDRAIAKIRVILARRGLTRSSFMALDVSAAVITWQATPSRALLVNSAPTGGSGIGTPVAWFAGLTTALALLVSSWTTQVDPCSISSTVKQTASTGGNTGQVANVRAGR